MNGCPDESCDYQILVGDQVIESSGETGTGDFNNMTTNPMSNILYKLYSFLSELQDLQRDADQEEERSPEAECPAAGLCTPDLA